MSKSITLVGFTYSIHLTVHNIYLFLKLKKKKTTLKQKTLSSFYCMLPQHGPVSKKHDETIPIPYKT